MNKIEFSVDSASIIREAHAQFSRTAPGLCEGLNQIRIGLARLAARAIEIEDEPMLVELCRLGCVRATSATDTEKEK